MREAVLDFSSSFQHFLQVAGLSLLLGMGLLVFGVWVQRKGVFAVARRVLWSARGAFIGLVMFMLVLWAGTKPNLGLFPLQSGGEGTNSVVHVISQNQVDAGFALEGAVGAVAHTFLLGCLCLLGIDAVDGRLVKNADVEQALILFAAQDVLKDALVVSDMGVGIQFVDTFGNGGYVIGFLVVLLIEASPFQPSHFGQHVAEHA